MQFITNGRIITTKDQRDIESLGEFINSLFDAWSNSKGLKTALDPGKYYQEGDYIFYIVPEGMPLTFITDFGADHNAIGEKDIIELPRKIFEKAKYVFTDEESEDNAQQMAQAVRDKRELENEKKSVMANYKNKFAKLDAEVQQYSDFIGSGFDMREQECVVRLDFGANKKYFIATKDGRIVKEESLTAADRQLEFMFPAQGEDTGEQIEESEETEFSGSADAQTGSNEEQAGGDNPRIGDDGAAERPDPENGDESSLHPIDTGTGKKKKSGAKKGDAGTKGKSKTKRGSKFEDEDGEVF